MSCVISLDISCVQIYRKDNKREVGSFIHFSIMRRRKSHNHPFLGDAIHASSRDHRLEGNTGVDFTEKHEMHGQTEAATALDNVMTVPTRNECPRIE